MMKEIAGLCSALLLVSCGAGTGGKKGSVMLEGVSVTPGGHCESSAIMNALRQEGYDVTECMVTGAGGALSFMYEKGTFPYIGARNLDMRERFFKAAGIGFHVVVPEGGDAGMEEIGALLSRGIPVVLRVDMRYLPYLYGGKYGSAYMSFGWHVIALFGIDYDRGLAYVSDTEKKGLQTVALSDLRKARTSKTKTYPPHAEYFWADPPSGSPDGRGGFSVDPDALVRSSFASVLENYESGALDALERFGGDIAGLESYSAKKFLLPAVLEYMAGNIEDFGTGGASFRVLYRDFLGYAAEKSSFREAAALIPPLDESIAAWHGLSRALREASPKVKKMSDAERTAEFARLGEKAKTVYESEKVFYNAMKDLYRGE